MKFPQSVITNSIQVANILREAILNGEFLPGAKLREIEISESLSISRTPIREAFRLLESEGLLEVTPNKGVKVVSLSESDIDEIYEFRELIEVFAINKACEYITDKDIIRLENIVSEMEGHLQKGDYKEYLRCSTGFHHSFIELCGNSRVIEASQRIWNSILAIRILGKSDEHIRKESINDHRKILHALKSRDKILAIKLVKEHVATGLKIARTGLKNAKIGDES